MSLRARLHFARLATIWDTTLLFPFRTFVLAWSCKCRASYAAFRKSTEVVQWMCFLWWKWIICFNIFSVIICGAPNYIDKHQWERAALPFRPSFPNKTWFSRQVSPKLIKRKKRKARLSNLQSWSHLCDSIKVCIVCTAPPLPVPRGMSDTPRSEVSEIPQGYQ